MPNVFDFLSVKQLRAGAGALDSLGDLAAGLGSRALLVCGGRSLREGGHLERIVDTLRRAAVDVTLAPPLIREPLAEDVNAAVAVARKAACDLVISVGGGSALDLGKAVAGVAPNGVQVEDYLEGVGANLDLTSAPLPQIAVPTTAGTGSEATRNGVIGVPAQGVKRSIRDERLVPAVALLDPALAAGCPPRQTAYSGLDALSQLIEPYVSRRASPVTDALTLKGIALVARSLERAVQRGDDLEARGDMALAAYFSGLALSNAGLGLVHALAGPLGGLQTDDNPIPHGCLCGMLLGPVMRFNLQDALARHAEIGRLLTGEAIARDEDAALAGVEWVQARARDFELPTSLAVFGIDAKQAREIVRRCNPGPLKTNPRAATEDELVGLLPL